MAKPRNYVKEYAAYQGKPEQIAKRSERNSARRVFEKANGDLPSTEDVDHKVPLSKNGTSNLRNLRAVSQNANTSFSRTKTGAMKSQTSARERKK